MLKKEECLALEHISQMKIIQVKNIGQVLLSIFFFLIFKLCIKLIINRIGNSQRSNFNNLSFVPGPGNYMIKPITEGPKWGFGTS
jgi:hypothetical protein